MNEENNVIYTKNGYYGHFADKDLEERHKYWFSDNFFEQEAEIEERQRALDNEDRLWAFEDEYQRNQQKRKKDSMTGNED